MRKKIYPTNLQHEKPLVFKYIMLTVLILFLTSCAQHYTHGGTTYGFFSGIWHGFLIPFSITGSVISFFSELVGINLLKNITIIGQPNTGIFYYVGMFLGVCFWAGGSSH